MNLTFYVALVAIFIASYLIFPSVKVHIYNFLTYIFVKILKYRSDYTWKWRQQCIKNRNLKILLDKILHVDSDKADLNASNKPSERIRVLSAHMTKKNGKIENESIDFKDQFNLILSELDGNKDGYIFLSMVEIFDIFGFIPSDPWFLLVKYIGHSNVEKKIPAREFSVMYVINIQSENSLRFPPYKVSECIKSGFSAPKVKSATTNTGVSVLDSAKVQAGLRCNFYNDCPFEEVMENYMNKESVTVTIGKKIYEVGNK